MLHIEIRLPADRAKQGRLRLYAEATLLLDVPVRGKADNQAAAQHGNPSRDPTRPYGDTPSGWYAPVSVVPAKASSVARIGRFWIPMEGAKGDALTARIQGREGLGIHAGRGDGELIATHGCVRLRDADFAGLVGLMAGRTASLEIIDVADAAPKATASTPAAGTAA